MVGKLWVDDKVEYEKRTKDAESRLSKAQDGYKEWRNALKGWKFNEFVKLMDEALGGESTPKKETPRNE
jgi:hypothetical protein